MKQLQESLKHYRKQLILGPVFKLLEAIFELFLPLLMAKLIDEGILQQNWQQVRNLALWMVFVSVLGLLCAIVCQYYASIASQGFGTDIRNRLMAKINQFSFAQLNQFSADTLTTRVTNDVNQLQLAVAMFIRLFVRAPFLSIGSVIMAFYIDWQIGCLFLLILPIFISLLLWVSYRSVPLYRQMQQQLEKLSQQLQQTLSGVRVIRAFGRMSDTEKNFDEATDNLTDTSIQVTDLSAWLSPATLLMMNLGVVAIFYLGGWKINEGTMQPGQLLALINYMNQMLLALIVVANLVVIFTRAQAAGQRVDALLAVPTSPLVDERQTTPAPLAVTYDNVSFSYPEQTKETLKQLSFHLKPAQTLGIIGPTGSGKTTLLQLLLKFYEPTAGEIFVNDVALTSQNTKNIRENIAIVPQKATLFRGTIRENLQWGKENASDDDCWQALQIAQADTFVRQLPQQLDTPIFENGQNLSGGQRQRLTIARAIIKQPTLLLIDDALSALDYATELQLRKALQKEATTTIIVSQRVRSIQNVNHILVLQNGEIVNQGTHEDLCVTSETYRAFVTSQEVSDNEA